MVLEIKTNPASADVILPSLYRKKKTITVGHKDEKQ